MLKKSTQKGFTIVELLIVIVVIGILAALVLNTFAGIQQRARDTERKTDVNSIATQLEAYYNLGGQGSYPALAEVNATTLKGLDPGALEAPGQTGSSLIVGPTTSKDKYGYVTAPTACTTAAKTCKSFVLSWFTEENDAAVVKNSLNQ